MPFVKPFLDAWSDLRHAVRALGRAPGFAAVAIATLALGIGASTAMFTVVDSVLLRPLRFPEPDRLVMVRPSSGARLSSSYLDEWRRASRTLHDLVGWTDARVNLTGMAVPLEIHADRVTTNFFETLGTPALVGRTLTTDRDLSRVEPEVVLSYGLWQRLYGGDPAAVGRAVTLDGATFTIVGVMPDGFTIRTNELAQSRAELWMPLSLVPESRVGMGGFLNVVGRLAEGVTIERASEELSSIALRIEAEYPSYSRDWAVGVQPLLDATVRDVRVVLLVLFGGVAILLLIACANVANLVLSRAVSRQSEFAIRMALGASRGRLARQFLVESLVLAAAGGSIGVLAAAWGTRWLVSVIPAGLELPRMQEIDVDLRILGFALAATIATAVAFGLLPVVHSARASVSLRDASRGVSASRSRTGVTNTLVIAEVALAVVLLAAAGLLARSFWALSHVHPGFEAAQVLTIRTTLPALRYDTDDRIRAYADGLLERTATVPGVLAVGSVGYLPLGNIAAARRFEIAGRPEVRLEDQKFALTTVVGGRYFEAMRIPLLRGRLPNAADAAETEPVFVIDERLAHQHWPDGDALGAQVTWRRDQNTRLSGRVVGIVGSVRWTAIAAEPWPAAYLWFPQAPERELTLVARVVGEPSAMAAVLSRQITALDSNQPAGEIRPMRELVSAELARPRFTMLLLAGFACAALLLASIGLYGVLAFAVAQRTREIGLRVAMGAQYRDVLTLVMRRGALLVAAGLVLGIASALALGRLVASLLYGVRPGDPATLVVITLFLTGVALLATYLPARRAARVDPTVALRVD